MGAPPALPWAADFPDEVRGPFYMEVPVMLSEILSEIICYTPTAMAKGSMWWWILPLAPDVPERLVIGHERAFLTWFFEIASPCFIPPESGRCAVVPEGVKSPYLSFIAQRHNRVHAHRAARGDETGKERYGAEQDRHARKGQRIGARHAQQHTS